jgi:23S rRNA (guanosine2251-2'-O)-methyltransferase
MPGREIIYGMNPVLEALRANRRRCHEVYIAQGRREKAAAAIAAECERRSVPLSPVARGEIARISRTDRHQGVAAEVDPFPYSALEGMVGSALSAEGRAFLLVLDGITDPQNLGSIMRTAHLLGAQGVILPRDNSAPVTAAVAKASAGACEYLPVAQVTNLARTIGYLKEKGIWVTGAAAEGEKSLYDCDFKGLNVAIVLGSEGAGMRRLVRESCDYTLYIPMQGKIASYNVSVAGALIMGEVARQRRS